MRTCLALVAVFFMLRSPLEGQSFNMPEKPAGMSTDDYQKLLFESLGSSGGESTATGNPSTEGEDGYGNNPVSDMIGEQFFGMGGGQKGMGGGQQQATSPKPTPVYDPKPSTEGEDGYGNNPVSNMIGEQFFGMGGGQKGMGGGQQQATSPKPTPVYVPKGKNSAAESVALALVDALRNVLNTENTLPSKEEKLMKLCEDAVAKQQPSMTEMKKTDRTLIDVLAIWREKFTTELVNFYQTEVEEATNAVRGSPQVNSMLELFGECVRPKLVLMKV